VSLKLKFIKEENRYLVIEYISETEYYNFNYNNRKKPVNKGYPLDDFLQQNKKYFSYKTMILDKDDRTFEVEIIFHDYASEVLYFLQN
jgi:hypothetical protein